MSWWNAIYKNYNNEYEITFGSKEYEKTKAVEKVCAAVIDGKVNSPDDVEIVRHGRWDMVNGAGMVHCSACDNWAHKKTPISFYDRCPNCGVKMDLKGE